MEKRTTPGVTALQVTPQLRFVVFDVKVVVLKMTLTILLLLVTPPGKEVPIGWPVASIKNKKSGEPQLFPIKVVPSPSTIVR